MTYTRYLRARQLMGTNVVVSSYLTPVQAVALSADFTAASDECIASMNAWLLEQFGTKEDVYWIDSKTVVVSPKTYEALKHI